MYHLRSILRWLLSLIVGISLGFVIVYNFVFENYEVLGESIECSTNSPIEFNYTCKLDKRENNTQYWSFEGDIPDGITFPNMMARVTTYHLVNGVYKPIFLKNTTIDICEHSGGQFSTLFIAAFLPDMFEKSNFNQPCPFSGSIYMRNFQFSRSLKLPRIVPGKWLLNFVFYAQGFEDVSFNMKVYLDVRPIGWLIF